MIGVVLLWLLTLLALLIVGLLIAGRVARRVLINRFPPPGTMVEVQGHRLHVRCEGQGPVTVLLESGLNDFSLQWSRLQPLVAQAARTCSYDRAGLGWSEPSPHPPTIDNAVKDLRAVLESLYRQTPLILVGHSYGSLLVRMYAQQYPRNIKAIILLDPANEFMAERIPGYTEALNSGTDRFKKLARLASLGLVALSTSRIPADLLPEEALYQYRAVLASRSFLKAAAAESAEMAKNLQAMQGYPQAALAQIPVTIISRGQSEPIPGLPDRSATALEGTWAALQSDLVERFNAKHLIAERSGHNVQLSQPELVYECIKSFIDEGSPANDAASN
jgi:pimeloyl-ACP methyl ester carboxylesterase